MKLFTSFITVLLFAFIFHSRFIGLDGLNCFDQSTVPVGDFTKIGKAIACNFTTAGNTTIKEHCYKIGDGHVTTRRCGDEKSESRATKLKINLTAMVNVSKPMCKETKIDTGPVTECFCVKDSCNGSSKIGQVSFLWSFIIFTSMAFTFTTVLSPSSTNKN